MRRLIQNSTGFLILLLISALCCVRVSTAQIRSIVEIQDELDFLAENVPYDKIYLKTDKPFYLTKDTIRFQAYIVDGATGELLKGKSFGFVYLLDEQRKVLSTIKIKVTNGLSAGYIPPQEKLSTGKYVIVAHTQAMTNYSQNFYFNKTISIFNECPILDQNESGFVTVNFFSEGGQYAAGVFNSIGIESLDEDDKPIKLEGYIANLDQSMKIPVQTDDNGLSLFQFEHILGENYNFHFNLEGEEKVVSLPKFSSNALAVSIQNKQGHVEVKLNITDGFLSKNETIHLLIHQSNRLIYTQSIRTNKQRQITTLLPNSGISNGLFNLVILDENLSISAERLYYTDKRPLIFDAKLELAKNKYDTRESLTPLLDLSKMIGKSKEAIFSVSVYDKTINDYRATNTPGLKSYFFLNAELDDRINNPDYYFTEEGKNKINDMLITKSGTRIDWKNLLSPDFQRKEKIESNNPFLSIRGRLVTEANGTSAPANSVMYFFLPERQEVLEARCDADGNIAVKLYYEFYDTQKLYYYIDNIDSQEKLKFVADKHSPIASINLQNEGFKKLNHAKINRIKNTQPCDQYAINYKKRSIISDKINQSYDFYLSDTTNQPVTVDAKSDTELSIISDLHIDLDDYVAFANMNLVVREIVNNVSIRKKKNEEIIRVYSDDIKHTFKSSPLIIIDNYLTFDQDVFLSLSPKNIQYIDVISSFRHLSKYGKLGENGVIIVRSKPVEKGMNLGLENATIEIEGFQKFQKFSENTKLKKSIQPDFRPLIYWSPMEKMDHTGYKNIEFTHSDDISTFTITVEGVLLENGEPFQKILEYQVEPKNKVK